jgi:hypothetical protein
MTIVNFENLKISSKCEELQYTVEILRERISDLEKELLNTQIKLELSKACILEMT